VLSKDNPLYRWLWLCLPLAILAAAVVLLSWGLTPVTALLIALCLSIPVVLVWLKDEASRPHH
jgi:hypothetical protein